MTITNCKQCNRVFKRVLSAYCPVCLEKFQGVFREIYYFVQNTPPIELMDLSERFHCPISHLEDLLYEGKFGPGSKNIITLCYRCNRPINHIQRKGWFCQQCGDQVEEAAQHAEQPRKSSEPEHKKVKEPYRASVQNLPASADGNTATQEAHSHAFGFRRTNHDD